MLVEDGDTVDTPVLSEGRVFYYKIAPVTEVQLKLRTAGRARRDDLGSKTQVSRSDRSNPAAQDPNIN